MTRMLTMAPKILLNATIPRQPGIRTTRRMVLLFNETEGALIIQSESLQKRTTTLPQQEESGRGDEASQKSIYYRYSCAVIRVIKHFELPSISHPRCFSRYV